MNSNVMARDQVMVTQTDGAYGSNRNSYDLFVIGLCGNTQQYNSGTLVEKQHKVVNYDVSQKFPEDEFAAALKSTQTELPQVTGHPREFKYNQLPFGVEFILSRMTDVNPTNITTGIIKNLLKKFDFQAYVGVAQNEGYKNNSKAVTTTTPMTGYDSFKAAVDAAMKRLKAATDFTGSTYGDINLSYAGAIADWLSETNDENVSNRDKLLSAYPSLVLEEMPSNLEPDDTLFAVSQRSMLTFHYASLPALYANEAGKYGLSNGSLYTYESMAVEAEEVGAIQIVLEGTPVAA